MAHVKGGIAHAIRELEAGRLDANRGNAMINGYRVFAQVLGADLDGKGVQVVIQREPAPVGTGGTTAQTAQDDEGVPEAQPEAERSSPGLYGLPPGGAKA